MPPPPMSQFSGFDLVELGDGAAIFEMKAAEGPDEAVGSLHGGILCDLSDAAMGCAFASTLPDHVSYTMVELKLNFFKPIWTTKLRAVGKVTKREDAMGLVECQVYDSKDSLVAHATGTCMIVTGE